MASLSIAQKKMAPTTIMLRAAIKAEIMREPFPSSPAQSAIFARAQEGAIRQSNVMERRIRIVCFATLRGLAFLFSR
jgi:hypothetical protein